MAYRTSFPYAYNYDYNDSGVMIPPPLRADTRYQASITWEGPTGKRAVQRVKFVTARASELSLSGNGDHLVVTTHSPQPVYFVLTHGLYGAVMSRTTLAAAGASKTMILASGVGSNYNFCFYQPQGSGYTSVATCAGFTYYGTEPANVGVSIG